MILTAFNPSTDNLEKTYLDSAITAGTLSLTVKNNQGFNGTERVLIGEMGGEKSELVTLTGTTGSTGLTADNTNFAHDADTPIYKLQWDQVRFYRSTTGENGTFTSIQLMDIDVDNADKVTEYDDVGALSTYAYKIALYNSITSTESTQTDPIPGGGYRRNEVGYIIDQCQQEVGDLTENFVTRSEWMAYFNDVNDDIQTYAAKPCDFLHTRATLAHSANTNYINFPTDSNGNQTMWKFDRIDYNFTDSTTSPVTDETYTLRIVSPEDFRNKYTDNTIDSTTVDDKTQIMCIDTSVNRFRFWPPFKTASNGTLYLHYWKYFNLIDSEGDVIETPTPRVYKLYAKAMYYLKRSVQQPTYVNQHQQLMQDYMAERARLTSHNRKDQGTPRQFSLETPTFKSFRR